MLDSLLADPAEAGIRDAELLPPLAAPWGGDGDGRGEVHYNKGQHLWIPSGGGQRLEEPVCQTLCKNSFDEVQNKTYTILWLYKHCPHMIGNLRASMQFLIRKIGCHESSGFFHTCSSTSTPIRERHAYFWPKITSENIPKTQKGSDSAIWPQKVWKLGKIK